MAKAKNNVGKDTQKKKEKAKLLNEATVRRFMKLANVGGVSNSLLREKYGYEQEEELNEMPDDLPDDMGDEGGLPDEGGAPEEESASVDPDVATALATRLGDALASAIEDVLDVPVDVSSDEGGGEDMEMGGGEEELPPGPDDDMMQERDKVAYAAAKRALAEMDATNKDKESVEEEEEVELGESAKEPWKGAKDQKLTPATKTKDSLAEDEIEDEDKMINELAKRVAIKLKEKLQRLRESKKDK